MTTARQDRIAALRAELHALEAEEGAPKATREALKTMSVAEINRLFDAGDLDHLLRPGDRPTQPIESGPAA